MKSELEEGFLKAWLKAHPRIVPEREYKWHPKRLFRADFAFVEQKVLIEIQGTLSYKSRHLTPTGYHDDCQKMCLAQTIGWRILYFDSYFKNNWNEAVKILERVLGIE